ncbi:hypothetical protein M441DRAFT_440937 [Trichoderma asperellum CBS 433.97]|uniref:Uncharacterized protein n=1 Tax=Trichoderma asperellum (strain ATCC 204424 / CBS 433.97 / NBRC 101777) TaxID=1042311 RepID=A0A2T3Z484_TRIA4|nr:hypothetical protein M441DRAFT_440937 [Trichoderma asperellum CBS 433.97]PTB39609.1 hypothetical protein M441DRAFT_440937 [Trichoderma asperellum CBS 433.97]
MTYDVGLMSHATFQPLFLLPAIARRLTNSGICSLTDCSDEPISECQVLIQERAKAENRIVCPSVAARGQAYRILSRT